MASVLSSSPSGNATNASVCVDERQHAAVPALLCLVFFCGFLLNAFSLWVFCCRLRRWSSSTVLQFHLALSDAIAAPVTPMMAVYFAAGNDWPFGHFLCQVKIALLSSHFYGSTVFLTLVSVQRYVAVVRFNRDSCMRRKSFVQKLCAAVWALLLAKSLVYAFTLPPSREDGHSRCLSIHQRNLTDAYFLINFLLFFVGFLLPFCVSVLCYRRLASKLTRLNMRSAKGLQVKVKSQRMVGTCLLIFGLCFLPLNVVRTAAVVLKKFYPHECRALRQAETAYYASWILAGVNGCLDPLLYFFGSQSFRNAFRSLRVRPRTDAPNRSDSERTPSGTQGGECE